MEIFVFPITHFSLCIFYCAIFSEDKKIERKLYQSMNTLKLTKSDCSDDQCDTKNCKPKQDDHEELRKMACVLVGYALMSLLAVWV